MAVIDERDLAAVEIFDAHELVVAPRHGAVSDLHA